MWYTISEKKQVFHGEVTNKRKNGQLYTANISITPILDKTDEILFYVNIQHDITKEKEIDRAKTEFVSLASHQLRTPLSAISWYSEMLLDGDIGRITRQQRDCLEEIHHGSMRMADLVNSLLNVSRLEIGTFIIDPVPLQIVDIANEALKELEPQLQQKQIQLETSIDEIPITPLDKKLTFMIFQNLLSNAVKYTPEKGVVNLRINKDNQSIVVVVSDSGIGIPKDQQDKIFQKLFRARNASEFATEGTGLGLYIVKTILDNSGGNVSFVSSEGQGTTFTVRIPLKGMKAKKGTKGLN